MRPARDLETAQIEDVPISYRLPVAERRELERKVNELVAQHVDPRRPVFYDSTDVSAQVPEGLRHFLEGFRRREPAGAALVTGLPVRGDETPCTPASWSDAVASGATRPQDVILALCGLGLGEPFGWCTPQGGSIVQNVLPVRGDELAQSGHGSQVFLEFHTEDAFHPSRPDYLLLLCVRNDDRVPTVLASVRDVRLPDAPSTL